MNNNSYGQGGYVSTDRFGRPYTRTGAKDKKGNGFPRGYVTIGKDLYQIEVGPSKKEGVECWLTVTKMDRNRQNRSL